MFHAIMVHGCDIHVTVTVMYTCSYSINECTGFEQTFEGSYLQMLIAYLYFTT